MFNFSGNYIGRVLDNNDPKKEGRLKIKVLGVFDDLQVDSIPWAYPSNNITGGTFGGGGFFSLPKIGSIVRVNFEKGNIYKPYWAFQLSVNKNLKQILSDEFYTEAHSLIFDEETRTYLYKTKEEGLVLKNTENIISIEENRVRIKQIPLEERNVDSFNSEYSEGDEFPEERDSPDEPSNRTENEIILTDDSIEIKRFLGGQDSPSNINSVIINDDKISVKFNEFYFEITENGISLGDQNQSEFNSVLFQKLKEWQENLIDALGNLEGVPTPSGPTRKFKDSPKWFTVDRLKNQIDEHKSEKITLIK